jgi:hypothetical protein
MALNNVTFVTPGGERWTLLGNALHFVSEAEAAQLDPALRARMRRDGADRRRRPGPEAVRSGQLLPVAARQPVVIQPS